MIEELVHLIMSLTGGKKVTKEQLERGCELQNLMNRLWSKKKCLEQLQALCFENMDIAKRTTHSFCIQSMKENGTGKDLIEISAHAAYVGVCEDIKKIEKELDKLGKEFSDL